MSEDFIKPKALDQEIILDENKIAMSKTNKDGIFEFANDYFMEISGYEEYELMGKSMFCVQHPDMPEVIFKHMWEKLLNKENFQVIMKNLTKSGKYYWSFSCFSYKVDTVTGEVIGIFSKRYKPSKESIDFFSKLYKTLLNIEKKNDLLASEKFIIGFLEEKKMNFNELILNYYKNFKPDIYANKPFQTKETPIKPLVKTTINKEEILTENLEETTPLKEDKSKSNSKEKKGFFQKFFGKTEEEIEEERRRKLKK